MKNDVFVVIIHDPCGASIIDSIHHHANGRGKTYLKTGALSRIRELEHNGLKSELMRLPTDQQLQKRFKINEF